MERLINSFLSWVNSNSIKRLNKYRIINTIRKIKALQGAKNRDAGHSPTTRRNQTSCRHTHVFSTSIASFSSLFRRQWRPFQRVCYPSHPLLFHDWFYLVFDDNTFCISQPFGIAFDIDGVILRGGNPIGNSPQALRRLYHDSGL